MPLAMPKVRDDLTVVELDGEAVVYDEVTTELHILNPTATILFGLCDGSSTIEDISAEIAEAFGVPAGEVQSQVDGFLADMRSADLLSTRGDYAADRTEPTSVDP